LPVGVVDTVDGREITLYNAGSFNAVLKDQNVVGGRQPLRSRRRRHHAAAEKSVTLRYRTKGALNRWEVKGSTAAPPSPTAA
jgi:hypothetical protein